MAIAIHIENGQEKTSFSAEERVFSTGNKGYLANGVAVINGKRYKCNLKLVELIPKAAKVVPAAAPTVPTQQV